MAKFKNVKTGNIVRTENKATIALMEKSANYVAVTTKGKAAGKAAEKTGNGENAE